MNLNTYEVSKRCLDILLSLVGLVVLFPIFLAVALATYLSDFGPVFFVQTRVGKNGKPFNFYKFRSMVRNADEMRMGLANQHPDLRTFKIKRDPRITKIGAFIRKASIDELPQLVNVIKGDMSLVGPRPPLPREVALYSDGDKIRLTVKPGLTCLWQVSGRSDLSFDKQIELDIEYISKRSLSTDLNLILKTVPAVLKGKGAY